MGISLKPALYSGLLFPGVGQLVLKQFRRGYGYMAVAGISLALLLREMINRASAVVEHIQANNMAPDLQLISQLLKNPPGTSSDFLLNLATLLFVLCWSASIIDAYRSANPGAPKN